MSGPTIYDIIARWRQYNELGGNTPWHGRSGYLEFDRQLLLSYRTPIACYHPPRFASNKNGYVLLLPHAENTPWGAMANHLSRASREVTWEKFRVPNVGTINGYPTQEARVKSHQANCKWFVEGLHTLADGSIKQFRARDPEALGSMPKCMDYLINSYRGIEDYMSATGAEFELPDLPDIIMRVSNERERLWAKWSDPKAVARRERAAARKAAIQALNIGD